MAGSELVLAAVDVQGGAEHEAAVRGGEEGDGGGDLLRASRPADRNSRREFRLDGGRVLLADGDVDSGGVDRTRRDRVDPDVPVLQLVGPGTRERPDRGLRRRVQAEGLRPSSARMESFKITEAPSLSNASAFCTVSRVPRTLTPKI